MVKMLNAALAIQLVSFFFIFIAGATVAVGADAEGQFQRIDQSVDGMVAAAHPLAVDAGLEMLQQGGNAIDAAVATAFAIAVVEPFGSSIAGCGIALSYSAAQDAITAYNYRSQAPAAASLDTIDFSDRDELGLSPRGPAVGGVVAGLCMMHEDGGTLPLASVIAPAIRFAEEGFPAGPTLVTLINDLYHVVEGDEGIASILLDDGFPPEAGTIIKNPDLAASLRLIAENGPSAMYGGPLGDAIATHVQSLGGIITAEDYAVYEAIRDEPIMIDYRGYTVYGAPAPFGGMPILQSLQLLERLPLATDQSPISANNVHLMAEVMKFSAADRSPVMGDPRFVDVPVEWVLSDEYADQRVKDIDPKFATTPDDVESGENLENIPEEFTKSPGDPGSTTHLTVIDGDGNAVSITQTLGHFFGSGIMVPGTGIMLNDQMRNYSRRKYSPNFLMPGKRMRSTQAPTIVVKDGELIFALGSPGNYRIITTIIQLLVFVIDFDLELEEALDLPRIYSRNSEDRLIMESRFTKNTYSILRERGHDIQIKGSMDLFFGGAHAILRDPETGMLTGGADKRRDGVARGLHVVAAPVSN